MPPSRTQTAIISHRGIAAALDQRPAPPETGEETPALPPATALRLAQQAAEQVEPDPVRRAELLAHFAEALRQIERADQETDPDVLSVPQDQVAALIQSRLAEGDLPGTVAEPTESGGEELKFAPNDLLGWFLSLFSWLRGLKKHPPVRPASAVPDEMADDVRLLVVGDWGTGLYGAPIIADTVRKDPNRFDLLLHLGDVYYAGTPKEVQQRFLALWPSRPGAVSRALNSNHEMYSGGWAYFDVTLPRFEQSSSYFALHNHHWVLICLDTGYHEHDLDDEQVKWLNEVVAGAANKGVILFSHHQLYSLLDVQGRKLYPKLASLLESNRITAWYWGHEHHCVLYDPHDTYGLAARCIGHGGIPQPRKDVRNAPVEKTVGDAQWRRLKARNLVPAALVLDGPNQDIPGKEDKYGPHGYAVLELHGDRLTEIICSARGVELWRQEFRKQQR